MFWFRGYCEHSCNISFVSQCSFLFISFPTQLGIVRIIQQHKILHFQSAMWEDKHHFAPREACPWFWASCSCHFCYLGQRRGGFSPLSSQGQFFDSKHPSQMSSELCLQLCDMRYGLCILFIPKKNLYFFTNFNLLFFFFFNTGGGPNHHPHLLQHSWEADLHGALVWIPLLVGARYLTAQTIVCSWVEIIRSPLCESTIYVCVGTNLEPWMNLWASWRSLFCISVPQNRKNSIAANNTLKQFSLLKCMLNAFTPQNENIYHFS